MSSTIEKETKKETVKQERLQSRLEPEINALRAQCQTLQLATIDENNHPHVSYAPFIFMDGSYYILISDIANHARNLLACPTLSLMLIEDESASKQLFARKRLSFSAEASVIECQSEHWVRAIAQLKARFGEIIDGLSTLNDFKLFQLNPIKGRYVKGFGQAFDVNSSDLVDVVHLQQGHQRRGQ